MTDSDECKPQLRLLREAAGLTRPELGKRVGVSDRQVYDWENGLKLPRIDRAAALARELEVTLKTLCQAMGIGVEGIPDIAKDFKPDDTPALQRLREVAGLTQEALAKQIPDKTGKNSLHRQVINSWERGAEPELTPSQVKALCHALRITLDQLPDNFGPPSKK